MAHPTGESQTFEQSVAEADHREANWINFFYHQLSHEGFGGNILATAIEQAEADLAADVPGANEFGYQVARNAWRWLNYYKAYVKAAEEAGAWDDNRLEFALTEQGDGQEGLSHGNPTYFNLYDWLQRERQNRARYQKLPPNPVELSRAYAAGVLANVLDTIIDNNADASDYGEQTSRRGSIQLSHGQLIFNAERRRTRVSIPYELGLRFIGEGSAEQARTDYELNDRDVGMQVSAYTGDEPSFVRVSNLLGIADTISQGRQLVYERRFIKTSLVTPAGPQPTITS